MILQERDQIILQNADRYGIITIDLARSWVGGSYRVIARRLQALTDYGYLTRYETPNGVIAYGTFKAPKKRTPQIGHRLLVAIFRIHLERHIEVANQRTEAEMRHDQSPLVPDWYFEFGGVQYFLEADTGTEDHKRIIEKIEAYKTQHHRLKENAKLLGDPAPMMRVLFFMTSRVRSEHLRALAVSPMFWFATLENFCAQPLGNVWFIPTDNQPRSLHL